MGRPVKIRFYYIRAFVCRKTDLPAKHTHRDLNQPQCNFRNCFKNNYVYKFNSESQPDYSTIRKNKYRGFDVYWSVHRRDK
jgi:hypothetical protein